MWSYVRPYPDYSIDTLLCEYDFLSIL
ncbi:hypothetical protein F383_33144 [Gossypium arboreum]|uniref:Uncharacterized protein n=1 Tax=Gossypium arboreum TaxID=29729 RepID=A0A0B0N449_GOSAR|nr:hypothetical protein F383_33144 [Gossypium arboreum]